MFKQLFKLTFITLVWSRYKAVIVSTLLLFAFFWLTHKIHADFLTYSELKNSQDNLGISYFIKWAVLISGIFVYFLYNHFARKKGKHKPKNKTSTSYDEKNDPFAEIRKKDKLTAKPGFTLDTNNKKK